MASVAPMKKASGKKKSKWKHIVTRPSGPRLHHIVESGVLESVAKRLSKKPGELNIADDRGRTPLHIAASIGHVEIINFLLAKCAIVEAVDNNGLTPLHYGCSCNNPDALLDVCSMLLTVAQADVTKKTHAGTTPLHYFVRNQCTDPAMFLEVLTLILARGADVNSQNKHGETPLHQAAGLGLEQSVIFLLSRPKIQIDLLDKHGESALHCACKASSRDVVRLLLDYNADCTISGVNGTPLEIAERIGDPEIVQLLSDAVGATARTCVSAPPAKRLQSLTFDPRVLELAEAQGYDTSTAIACLYQLQKRGQPTDNLELLIKEINQHSHHHQRECSICLSKEIDSLLLPCRHSATCIDCGERVMEQTGNCPICRCRIEDILKIFLS